MSAFEKSVGIAVAAITLVVSAGAVVVSAQGPWVAPPEAKNVKNPVKGIGNAKKSVETNCVSCHGPGGKGDGPASAALPPPKPANWTSEAVQKQTDGEIFWVIAEGIDSSADMLAYKKTLKEKEMWQIVVFIRSIGPKKTK